MTRSLPAAPEAATLLPPLQGDLSLQASYVWMAFAALLLAVLISAYVYLLVLERRGDFVARFRRLDDRLARLLPRSWGLVKRPFSLKRWYGSTLTASLVVVLATIYLFAEITESWTDKEALYRLDQAVHALFRNADRPAVIAAMRLVTHLADFLTAAVVSVLLGILLARRGDHPRLLGLFLAVGVGEALVWGLKLLFSRNRPEAQLASAVGHSFPSAHAFTAVVLYGFILYLAWRWMRHDGLRLLATAGLTLLILVICLSRILLNVHWTSDVIGGATIGLGWLVFSLLVARSYRIYQRQAAAENPRVPTGYSPGQNSGTHL